MITMTLEEIGTFMIESVYFLGAIFALAFSIIAYLEGRNAKKAAAIATAAAEKAEADMLIRVKEAEEKLESAAVYAGVDEILKDILKMAMEKPHLRDPSEITKMLGKDDPEYAIYARICMNFVETIYDGALKDEKLRATYGPTVIAQITLHGKWLIDKNSDGFKDEFREFVEDVLDGIEKENVTQEQIIENTRYIIKLKQKKAEEDAAKKDEKPL